MNNFAKLTQATSRPRISRSFMNRSIFPVFIWKGKTSKWSASKDQNTTATYHGKHRLTNVECMSPIMVLDWTIIFLYAQNPSTQHLNGATEKFAVSNCSAVRSRSLSVHKTHICVVTDFCLHFRTWPWLNKSQHASCVRSRSRRLTS